MSPPYEISHTPARARPIACTTTVKKQTLQTWATVGVGGFADYHDRRAQYVFEFGLSYEKPQEFHKTLPLAPTFINTLLTLLTLHS